MNQTYWISELSRLYKRSSEAIEGGRTVAVGPLTNEFNDALTHLKREFPDNPIVSSTSEVDSTALASNGGIYRPMSGEFNPFPPSVRSRPQALYEIRSRCERIANALSYDLPDVSGEVMPDEMTIITVEAAQSTHQSVSNNVTIESTLELVNHLSRSQGTKEELRDLIERYEEELSQDEPDESVLRQLLTKTRDKSTDVATNLAALALQQGLIDVLGLG